MVFAILMPRLWDRPKGPAIIDSVNDLLDSQVDLDLQTNEV